MEIVGFVTDTKEVPKVSSRSGETFYDRRVVIEGGLLLRVSGTLELPQKNRRIRATVSHQWIRPSAEGAANGKRSFVVYQIDGWEYLDGLGRQ